MARGVLAGTTQTGTTQRSQQKDVHLPAVLYLQRDL